MTTASIYEGQTALIPVVNAFGNVFEEWQNATAGQLAFTIASFQYTPGTRTLQVFKNGLLQQLGVSYAETSASVVTFFTGLVATDKVTFFAWATSGAALPSGGGVPLGGAAGQALVKTSASDYAAAWTNLTALASLLDSPRVNVDSATTVLLSPLALTTRNIQITGTTGISGFQIANGQMFAVTFVSDLLLTNSASLLTKTGFNIPVQAGDTCFIRAIADNIVEIIGYSSVGFKQAGNYFGYEIVTGSRTLTARDSGKVFASSVTNPNIVLPVGSSVAIGTAFTFQNSVNLVASAPDVIISFTSAEVSSTLTFNTPTVIMYRGGNRWTFVSGAPGVSALQGYANQNPAKIILPGGFMLYGGTDVQPTDANGMVTITYPSAFATAPNLVLVANGDSAAGTSLNFPSWNVGGSSAAVLKARWVRTDTGAAMAGGQNVRTQWFAIGSQ